MKKFVLFAIASILGTVFVSACPTGTGPPTVQQSICDSLTKHGSATDSGWVFKHVRTRGNDTVQGILYANGGCVGCVSSGVNLDSTGTGPIVRKTRPTLASAFNSGFLKFSGTTDLPFDSNGVIARSTTGYLYEIGGPAGIALIGDSLRTEQIIIRSAGGSPSHAIELRANNILMLNVNSSGVTIPSLATGCVTSVSGLLTSVTCPAGSSADSAYARAVAKSTFHDSITAGTGQWHARTITANAIGVDSLYISTIAPGSITGINGSLKMIASPLTFAGGDAFDSGAFEAGGAITANQGYIDPTISPASILTVDAFNKYVAANTVGSGSVVLQSYVDGGRTTDSAYARKVVHDTASAQGWLSGFRLHVPGSFESSQGHFEADSDGNVFSSGNGEFLDWVKADRFISAGPDTIGSGGLFASGGITLSGDLTSLGTVTGDRVSSNRQTTFGSHNFGNDTIDLVLKVSGHIKSSGTDTAANYYASGNLTAGNTLNATEGLAINGSAATINSTGDITGKSININSGNAEIDNTGRISGLSIGVGEFIAGTDLLVDSINVASGKAIVQSDGKIVTNGSTADISVNAGTTIFKATGEIRSALCGGLGNNFIKSDNAGNWYCSDTVAIGPYLLKSNFKDSANTRLLFPTGSAQGLGTGNTPTFSGEGLTDFLTFTGNKGVFNSDDSHATFFSGGSTGGTGGSIALFSTGFGSGLSGDIRLTSGNVSGASILFQNYAGSNITTINGTTGTVSIPGALTVGSCTGCGGISGLTAGKIPRATSSSAVADGSISDDGTDAIEANNFTVTGVLNPSLPTQLGGDLMGQNSGLTIGPTSGENDPGFTTILGGHDISTGGFITVLGNDASDPGGYKSVQFHTGTGTNSGYSLYDDGGIGFVDKYTVVTQSREFNSQTYIFSSPLSGSTMQIGPDVKFESHISNNGQTSPVLSSCGTSSAITSNSSDIAGEFTEGTLATGCVVTFNVAYADAPFCTVTEQSGLAASYTVSTSAITVTNIGALSSTKLNYMCVGRQ